MCVIVSRNGRKEYNERYGYFLFNVTLSLVF